MIRLTHDGPDPRRECPTCTTRWLDPVHACRVMPTRHCPAVYEGTCGDRPCARYESEDESPWRGPDAP